MTSKELQKKRLNPICRVILNGVYDSKSNFALFHGTPHIVKKIWLYVVEYWKENISVYGETNTIVCESTLLPRIGVPDYLTDSQGCFEVDRVVFPKPTGININMMPFLNSNIFSKSKLPEYCQHYWRIIYSACMNGSSEEYGKVWYLTIQESHVNKDKTQRLPGIHTGCLGNVYIPGSDAENSKQSFQEGAGSCEGRISYYNLYGIHDRFMRYKEVGGIYMASNIDESCMVYNCVVEQDKYGNEIIGKLGDVEHLREYLPKGHATKSDFLYWLTDRTPHESLPVEKSCTRQFIRIVSSQVSLWYKDHSTKNPNGVVPNPEITKVVRGSKFKKNSLSLVDTTSVVKKKSFKLPSFFKKKSNK